MKRKFSFRYSTFFLRALLVFLFAFCVFPASAQSILDFAPCSNNQINDPNYGDRLPATPNVVVDYAPDGAAFRWETDYGDLQCVLWSGSGLGILEITLTADAGYRVNVSSFEMGGWQNTDYTINSVQVIDVSSNTVLFSQNNVLIQGDFTGPRHTRFSFPTLLMAQSLRIRFDASNLGGNSTHIGIDNIVFSQIRPTAASVSVGGRIVTAQGRGISSARVFMTSSNGETQMAITNPFGFYHFAEVLAGETYIFSVSHKRYQFAEPTQVHFVTEERDNINFTALP